MSDKHKQNHTNDGKRNVITLSKMRPQELAACGVTIEVNKNGNTIEIKAKSDKAEIIEIDLRFDTPEIKQYYYTDTIVLEIEDKTYEHTLEVWAMDAEGNTSAKGAQLWKAYTIYNISSYNQKNLRNRFAKIGIKNINVEQISFEKQSLIYNILTSLMYRYPKAKKFIRTIWIENMSASEKAAYCDIQFLTEGAYIKIAIDKKILELPNEVIRYTLYYQFGHVMNSVMAFSRMEVKPGFMDYEKLLGFSVAYKNTATEIRDEVNAHDYEVEEMLTNYAFVSPMEYFAEAFVKKNYYNVTNKIVTKVFELFYKKI